MEKVCPEILIISNKHDYSTDYIVIQLYKMGISYLRLNRDQFSDFKISFNPTDQSLIGETQDFSFEITPEFLKSIYFRAPVYLRDTYQRNLSPDEQISRSQWASFIRGLVVFDNVLWVNHPQATYKAEIKPYQLYIAKKIGFNVPYTVITNTVHHQDIAMDGKKELIIKTLDSVILNIDDKEAFIYTNIIDYDELLRSDISNAPVVLQDALIPKTDIRATVIENVIFSVEIKKDDKGIDKDWRLEKDNVQYTKINLPADIEKKCIALVNELGLKFGAIDLVFHKEKYYFLEINPTGEWSWLMSHTKLEIDKEIVKLLLKGKNNYVQ